MNTRKIYINHIPISYDTNLIQQLFTVYGKITEVNYPLDRKTNKPKGYAFVTFEDADSAQKALEKNNEEIDGKILIVEIAKEKPVKNKVKGKKRNEK